jgi:hypothetical protein
MKGVPKHGIYLHKAFIVEFWSIGGYCHPQTCMSINHGANIFIIKSWNWANKVYLYHEVENYQFCNMLIFQYVLYLVGLLAHSEHFKIAF